MWATHRFADQRGARAAFTLSFLASSGLYLLLAAACSPALPGVTLLFASRLPGALMHTLPGRVGRAPPGLGRAAGGGGSLGGGGQDRSGGLGRPGPIQGRGAEASPRVLV